MRNTRLRRIARGLLLSVACAATSLSVLADDTPPSASITSPEPNGVVSTETITIGGNAGDDVAIGRLELVIKDRTSGRYWNGSDFQEDYVRVRAELTGEASGASWAYSFEPGTFGSYYLAVFVWDAAGNLGARAVRNFSAAPTDAAAPTITLANPADRAVAESPLTLTGSAADDVAVQSVELLLKSRDSGLFWNGTSFQSDYTRVTATTTGPADAPDWSYEFAPGLDGRYFVSAYARDTARKLNTTFATAAFSLAPASDPANAPTVVIDSIASGAVLPTLTTVTGTASDDVSVDDVVLVLENLDSGQFWDPDEGRNGYYPAFAPGQRSVEAVLTGPATVRQWSYDFDFTIDGRYRLTAIATDDDDQLSEPTASVDFRIASTTPTGNQPNLSEYRRVLTENFNGQELDPNTWRTSYYWGPYKSINSESQLYVDTLGMQADFDHDPFEFTGSSLKIVATPVGGNVRAPSQPPPNDPVWDSDLTDGFGHNADYDPSEVEYLSGVITSIDRFDAAYGYFEARMKIPYGRGLWPAFWLLNKKYVEDSPEIDIMENLGQRPDRVQHMYHYFKPNEGWRKVSTPEEPTTGTDFSNGFHRYGVAWEPGQIIWYIDGIERRRVKRDEYDISKQPMYLLANLAVNGWPGEPDDPDDSGVFPAELEIDYIHVWEKAPPAAITPAVLDDQFQLVFSDEFGGSTLSRNRWTTSYPWGPFFPIRDRNGNYDEEQYYVDSNGSDSDFLQQPFALDGGRLAITAEPLSGTELPVQPPLNDPLWQRYPTYQRSAAYDDGTWTPSYTSGVITSTNSFKFVNGYVEVRAKFPSGAGLWPSLQLISGYFIGPHPTIDIAAMRGEQPEVVHHSHEHSSLSGTRIKAAYSTTASGGQTYADEFHTYGIEWRRGVIKWYVDGEVVKTMTGADVSSQLMYITANLGVGGDFVGPVDPTTLPATMEIDYIRAYKRKDIH